MCSVCPAQKIDRVYDALLDCPIQTVVCRHEQSASFIAQGIARLTGKAGVCLVTSGSGTTNLVTGFATATAEGSPEVGLGVVVPRDTRLKQAHQCLDTATPMRTVSKSSVEVESESAIGEVLANALPAAERPRPGAAFVGLPNDVMQAAVPDDAITPVLPVMLTIAAATQLMRQAHNPVILVATLASEARAAACATTLPAVEAIG